MTVGVVGLGLIGGSFAKAYHEHGHRVLAYNRNHQVYEFARMSEDVDAELTTENYSECDLIIISVFPQAAIDWFRNAAPYISQHTLVIDACGTKQIVCKACFEIAEKYGLTFIGGHPMAGTHHAGFKYATPTLYNNAPMVIVPPVFDDIGLLDRLKELLEPCGFGRYSVTTAEDHDKMIAFTSQLAHIVSSAYIKSPTALRHKGFSAGSYRDMTRVAQLNPKMWSELFIENRPFLLDEIDILINHLQEYRDALDASDVDRLNTLLDEGRKRKEEVDGI